MKKYVVKLTEEAKQDRRLLARVEEAEADIAAGRFCTEEEMEAFMDNALEELKERKAA